MRAEAGLGVGGVRNPRLGLQGVNFPELQAAGWRRTVQRGCGPFACLFTLPFGLRESWGAQSSLAWTSGVLTW